ncbi:hypothetical protein ACFLT2_12425 [Acidobacteriota bacterium]
MKNCMSRGSVFLITLATVISTAVLWTSQNTIQKQISYHDNTYPLYPQTLDAKPEIPSPLTTKDGMEILLVRTSAEKFALMPVTVENGDPLHYSKRITTHYGKDSQLQINSGDFPSLAKTGRHSEVELDRKDMITGIPVSVITYIGRPGRFSGAGFMASDEDIISVLKGDNYLVKKLGLTHPQMARPLFHVWNIILKEIELDRLRRFSGIKSFFYNGKKVLLKAEGTKGWQVSIFQDEIQGRFDIKVLRNATLEERSYLKEKYANLSTHQMEELEAKLSSISFSEMAPYYIMRYGFYEGHTDYRADPLSIAYIFGLRSIEEIENAFEGNLHKALTEHFTK